VSQIKASRNGIAVAAIVAVLLFPIAAHAGIGDVMSLFSAINQTLSQAIGPVLDDVRSVEAQIVQLQQQVVWPQKLLAEARSLVQQVQGQFSRLASGIHALAVDSATLVEPSRLEKLLRSGGTTQMGQIAGAYSAVFQTLPTAQSATDAQRALLDSDDAAALAALKTATASDASGENQLVLADALEQQAGASAPGSAPLLAAQARVAELENQALLQQLLAAQLREEAALAAHENALRKQGAASLAEMRGNLLRLIAPPPRR
jgi:hypothetical protein